MSISWPAKKPGEILDYVWETGIDAGDTIATHTFESVDGSAVVDSHVVDGANIRAFVSGGTDGEINVFAATVTTAGGRTFDETIYLPVSADVSTDPSVATLQRRYPAFAAVDAGTIAYWLEDAKRGVDASWAKQDYAPALMALAAHNMSENGIVSDPAAEALASGLTRWRSGTADLQFSDNAVTQAAEGGFKSTKYGREYLRLLQLNRGGARVTPGGVAPCGAGYNGFAGPIPPWNWPW